MLILKNQSTTSVFHNLQPKDGAKVVIFFQTTKYF